MANNIQQAGDPGRKIIHRVEDAEGCVEVIDVYGMRLLHLGSPHGQSAMLLDNPDRVEFAYQRAMLAGLAFAREPRRALVLGLGGGVQAKFLLRNFPECRVDAVEFRPAVVEAARQYFGLPDDPRLAVHIGDARSFVLAQAQRRVPAYDLILVDIYDAQGMCGWVGEPDFLEASAGLVADHGIISLHAWASRGDAFWNCLEQLKLRFGWRALLLQIPDCSSVILLGLGQGMVLPSPAAAQQRALELEARLGIEFPRLLDGLAPAHWVRST